MKQTYKLMIALLLLGVCIGAVQATEYSRIIPLMTSNTAPTGNSSYVNNITAAADAYFLYDGSTATELLLSAISPTFLPIITGINTSYYSIAHRYAIYPYQAGTIFTPQSWTFEGSVDNINYDVLDTHTDYGAWVGSQYTNFTISNTVPYKSYRLVITKIGVDNPTFDIKEVVVYGEYLSLPVSSFSSTNVTPVTNSTGSSWGGVGSVQMQFNDTSTNSPTSWAWGVNDVTGNNTWVPLGTTRDTTPTFGVGNWSINLTATNEVGSDISDQITFVNVSSSPTPTVSFAATPTTGVNPMTVEFNDTTTSTSAITSYNVSFGTGEWWNETTFPGTNITHAYSTSGNYTVDWYVSNAEGTGTASTTITVWGAVHSAFSLFNTDGTAPHTTYLYDTSTNLTPGPVTYLTDFGEGNTSTLANTYFTWNATGTYNVTHTVSNGLSSETSFMNVTVGTPTPPVVAPVASFYGSPTAGNVPLTVSFTDVSSNTPTSWFWEFGDGTNSTLQNPSHQYNRSGFKTVNLTAANSAGSNITVRLKFVRVS